MPRPRNGPSRQPANANKAPRQKKLKEKKHRQPGDAEAAAASRKSRRKDRSFWGLVGTLTGFVSLFAWTVLAKHAQIKQKREDDKRVLAGMRRRPLRYTDHAACRLDCRFVTKGEVGQALLSGLLNDRKSELALLPCPKVVVDAAVDSTAGRRKNIQAVFAACEDETRVLTVIDKDTNWPCGPC